jgi:hypothetical protein
MKFLPWIQKWLVPPIVPYLIQKKLTPSGLFEGGGIAFKDITRKAKVYGEYGVGESTIWVHNNTDALIVSVETDPVWVEKLAQHIGSSRVELKHVDVGGVGDWGRPNGYSKMENFFLYFEGIWEGKVSPDVVLVDGRFRVSCFLTSLLQAQPGTIIIFDDYVPREFYHVVERIISPSFIDGRQAIFTVPTLNDEIRAEALKLRDAFAYCMD